MIGRVFGGLLLFVCLLGLGCTPATPDGTCLTDYDCEFYQLCGMGGYCLACDNCQRGWVGTCTAPVWPLEREPNSVWMEASIDGDVLVYGYDCESATSEYRYTRPEGEACFASEPGVRDLCDFENPF